MRFPNHLAFAIGLAVGVWLWASIPQLLAQTPWESSPARPAPLAVAQAAKPSAKVVDLGPPPKKSAARAPTSLIPPDDSFPTPGGTLLTVPPAQMGIPLPGTKPPSLGAALPPAPAGLPGKLPLPQSGSWAGSLPGAFAGPNALPLPSALPLPADLPLPSAMAPSNTTQPNMTSQPGGLDGPSASVAPLVNTVAGPSAGDNRKLISFGSSTNQPPPPTQIKTFHPGELIAVVGTDHILAGDMNVWVDPVIERNRDKIRDAEQESQIRAQLTRQILGQYVEVKAMYQEFFRDMVGTSPPDELEDMKKQVTTKAGKLFYEKQVPDLMERYKVHDVAALEAKLREKSMSVSVMRSQFIEQILSGELERKYIPNEYEIDRDEILAEYNRDREKWFIPARAKWQELTVRFDEHATRAEADTLIKELGNQMLFGGKSFEAVARQSSEGFSARDGGLHDWTSQGSLKSKALDAAIFSIELNSLSQIIEDEVGFHIIRVIEREQAHMTDAAETQAAIRKSLSKIRRDEAQAKFRAEVMKRTPIWTRWPEDIPGSRPLSSAIGEE